MPKEVTVKISPDGVTVDVDANGFVGGSCMDFMKSTLDALGEIKEKKLKPEYYETEQAGISIQV